MHGLLSAADLSRTRIERLIAAADRFAEGDGPRHSGAVVGLLFFEESLRTRTGLEAAAGRLSTGTFTVDAARHGASMLAPETLEDTIRSVADWCDVLCVRTPSPTGPALCAALTTTPIVNCGNGSVEHPVQSLVDLYAIKRLAGRVDNLSIALVGDLSAMRTAHSFALALHDLKGWRVRCVAPRGLELPDPYVRALADAGHHVETTASMDVEDMDLVYVAGLPAQTRIGMLYQEQQALYSVDFGLAERLRDDAHILCPLPRVDEISPTVDVHPKAAYFRQSAWSLWMRMALLDEQITSTPPPRIAS
jgi:aspartate carbamoyltransferase catalytic subunit